MISVNIFDIFGRQIKSENADKLMKEFKDDTKQLFLNIKDHSDRTEKIIDSIDISKNYISLKGTKRIVSVNPSINKNDVKIKEEFDNKFKKFEREINTLLKNLNVTIKDLDSKINQLDFSTNITDITNVVNEIDNKLKNHLNDYTFNINQLDYFVKDNTHKIINHITDFNNYLTTHP